MKRDLVLTCAVAGAAILLLTPGALCAQAPTQSQNPCDTDQHRQFDFWVGDWEVTQPDGTVVGSNRIEKILNGCVLKENWVGAGGMRGESYNLYTARAGGWHQTWVDTTGRLLQLDGALRDGKMVLAGETPGQDGGTIRHEIAWTPMKDGRVKQHWRISRDQGKTWSDAFVGLYARK